MPYSIYQKQRLLQVEIPRLNIAHYITEFSGVEAVSQPFEFLATVHFLGKIPMRELLGWGTVVTLQKGTEQRLFHGCITKVAHSEKHTATNNNERCYDLTLSPFTYYMDNHQDCRVFENLTVLEIAKQLCYERMYYDIDLNKVGNTYPKIAHVVQYNETDFAFLQRLFAYYGINYYFEYKPDGHYLTLIDDNSSLAGLGLLNFKYTGAEDADFSHWNSRYKLTTNKAIHRSLNPDSPTRAVECTNINKNAYAAKLPRGYMEKEFNIQTFDPVNDVPRLNKQQLDYWNRMQRQHSGQSNLINLKLANVFKLDHQFDTTKNVNYIITELEHYAEDNTHRVKGTDNDIVQNYHNSFKCFEKDDGIVPEPNYDYPKISGVQTAFIAGRKSKQPNMQGTLQTQIRNPWDRKSTSISYPLSRVRVATSAASNTFGHITQPREDSEVVIQYLEGNPSNPIILGSLYNKKNAPAIKTQNNPLHNVIRTKTLDSSDPTKHNEIHFIDNQGNEKLYIHAANQHITGVAQEATSIIGGNYTHTVAGDNTIAATDNITHMSFQKLTLSAGGNSIELWPNKINITANLVKAGNPGSPAICAMDALPLYDVNSPFDNVAAMTPMPKNRLEYPEAEVPLSRQVLETPIFFPKNAGMSDPTPPDVYEAVIVTLGKFTVLKNELVNPDTFDQDMFYHEACQAIVDFFADIEAIGLPSYVMEFSNKNVQFDISLDGLQGAKNIPLQKVYKNYLISGLLNCQVTLEKIDNMKKIEDDLNNYLYIKPLEKAIIKEKTIELGTEVIGDKIIQAEMTYSGSFSAKPVKKIEKANYEPQNFSQQVQQAIDKIFEDFEMQINYDPNLKRIKSISVGNGVNDCDINVEETLKVGYPVRQEYRGSKKQNVDRIVDGIRLSVIETLSVVLTITSKYDQPPVTKPVISSQTSHVKEDVEIVVVSLTTIGVGATALVALANSSLKVVRFVRNNPRIVNLFESFAEREAVPAF